MTTLLQTLWLFCQALATHSQDMTTLQGIYQWLAGHYENKGRVDSLAGRGAHIVPLTSEICRSNPAACPVGLVSMGVQR